MAEEKPKAARISSHQCWEAELEGRWPETLPGAPAAPTTLPLSLVVSFSALGGFLLRYQAASTPPLSSGGRAKQMERWGGGDGGGGRAWQKKAMGG